MSLLILFSSSSGPGGVPLGAVTIGGDFTRLYFASWRLGALTLDTESTWRGAKIGLQSKTASSTKTLASGTITRTTGTGAILTGDVAMRVMITVNSTASIPVQNDVAARLYVRLMQISDIMNLQIRRETGNVYAVSANFVTAAALNGSALAYITINPVHPQAFSLGVTRDTATGVIRLWQSFDDWETWYELAKASSSAAAGALSDADGDLAYIASGDLRDGSWLQVFQAQWGETDDINAVDAAEVLAWNYGGNLTNSPFNKADKDAVDNATHPSLLVEQNYSRLYLSRTITCGWDMDVPSPAYPAINTNLAAEFTYDACPLLPVVAGSVQSGALRMIGYGEFGITGRPFSYGVYNDDGSRPGYKVVVLTPGGTKLCALENAVLTNVQWDLNGPGMIEFTLPVADGKIGFLEVAEREVQVWRGPDLLHWGVIVRGKESPGNTVTFQCPGLGWYFTKRVVGTAETNYVLNPGFEAGGDNWIIGAYGLEPAATRLPADWKAYTTPERSISGARSLFMECSPDVYFGIFSFQFFFWEVDASTAPEGDIWSIVVWAYVPSAAFVGGRMVSFGEGQPGQYVGASLTRYSTTEFVTVTISGIGPVSLPKMVETINMPIAPDFPLDTWVRLEAPLKQPVQAGVTEWIQVQLGTPLGQVFYDEVSLTRNERLYYNNVDQATIIAGLVQHAQDTTIGKSNLRIGINAAPTGVLRTRVYEYANHELISDTLDEWPTLFNGVDWSIEITPDTRTFTTHYPQKGTRKPKQALVLGKNIATLDVVKDGEQTANGIIVMADGGEGSGREEALAYDPSSLEDGLVLEKAYNATPGSGINSLEAQADRGLRRYRLPVTMPVLTTYEVIGDELLGMITVGDIVPVKASNGWATLDGDFRIMSISLDPQTDSLSIAVNPNENWDLLP